MDIKKYLIAQIKKCKNRMNLARLIDCGIVFAAVGGLFGMACELASLIWPFYYVHLAAGLCFGLGLLAGTGYAIYRRADMGQAARRLDSFGLKERMVTAYELMDKGGETGDALAEMQRQDAFFHYNQVRDQIRIPLWPDKRHVLALILSVAMVVGLGLMPSPVRDQARLRHQVKEEAKEELEQLAEFVDALEGMDMESLTEEQKMQLQELLEAMQRSQEELAKADTWESLGAMQERLDYKYQQAWRSLERLASQLEDPGAAGIASAQALAQAASQDGAAPDLTQAAVSPGQTSSNPGQGDGDGTGGNGLSGQGAGDGGASGGEGAGEAGGQAAGAGENTDGQDGSGQDSGTDGSGSDSGQGRGLGSSNAVHDYVSIPNALAEDPSLTGEKSGDQNSDYFRQQNGLAWEGEHVDYNSVISQYRDNAYEGITRGKYPSGMESVIRDYFEYLNK